MRTTTVVDGRFGHKRQCPGCGARFYDMHAPAPECPRCEITVPAEGSPEAMLDPAAPPPRDPLQAEIEALLAAPDEPEDDLLDVSGFELGTAPPGVERSGGGAADGVCSRHETHRSQRPDRRRARRRRARDVGGRPPRR